MNELWQDMIQLAATAQSSGHLVSIPCDIEIIEEQGVPFVVRYAPRLIEKIRASQSPKKDNPFLPPEPELLVGPIGHHHQLVLNKFNVLPVHGLIISNAFVAQTDQLQLNDFAAVHRVLAQTDGLVFYNGGEVAGASQRHRHFQLVPRDMGAGCLPIQAIIDACQQHQHGQIFPFEHRLYWLPDYEPETLLDAWLKLEFAWQPYNLLLTRQWMLVIPRKQESTHQISVNSLGFAGALLAKNETERRVIRELGPMQILQQVCFAP